MTNDIIMQEEVNIDSSNSLANEERLLEFEIVVQTKDLSHALGFASSVVEKKQVNSELNSVKLTITDNFLDISATDVDIFLNQTLGASTKITKQQVVTTVPTKTFVDVVRKIPDQEFIMRKFERSNSLELIGSNCRFELLVPENDNFQTMEDIISGNKLEIPCSELSRIIEYTIISASDDETRYNLNGIYLHLKKQQLCSAATDGHRLSVAVINSDKNYEEFGVILPKKTAQEILKITKDTKNSKSDIEISMATNRIKFKCNNIELISKLIDGTFPEYSAFFPANNNNILKISKDLFYEAIERVSMVTVDKFRAVKLSISEEKIEITASGEAKGLAKEVLKASVDENNFYQYNGQDISIGLNPKYITDVLRVLKDKAVEFHFSDGYSPVLVKITSHPDDSFVIMPVKV